AAWSFEDWLTIRYEELRRRFERACARITELESAADEPKATDEGVADARRWIAYLESEPQHEPDISIARVLRDLVQFYEWALPQITNRTAEPPTAWQPIETAPKGGKWVLLWWPAVTDAPFVGYCVLGEWRAATSGDKWSRCKGPTHWMPLPSPPVTKSEIPAAAQSAANSGQCESRKAAQSGTAAGASVETSAVHKAHDPT